MSKMHYFSNKFSTFDIVALKLRDLSKLCFFKLIMIKSNFKKSVVTSFQWAIKITSPKSVSKIMPQFFFHFEPPYPPKSKFLVTPVATVWNNLVGRIYLWLYYKRNWMKTKNDIIQTICGKLRSKLISYTFFKLEILRLHGFISTRATAGKFMF